MKASVLPKGKLQRSKTTYNVGFALFVDFKKHYITFDLQTLDQAKQNRIFTRQITANTEILLIRISLNMEYYN